MTLGRDRRGADWRPSRPGTGRDDRRVGDGRKPWADTQAPYGGVEVEELPAQPVLAARRGRPGLPAALAAGVLVLIVAAGLGVLGGRPTPSPTSPALAAVSPSSSVGPGVDVGPRVTPAVPCRPLAGALPQLQLEADGRTVRGMVEVLHRDEAAPAPTAAIVPAPAIPSAPATAEVRSDVVTYIRTTGDVCATSWTFELSNADETIGLEHFMSPANDPEWARQDQFALDFARYRGGDFELSGVLTFPGLVARVSWLIRILPFDVPTPSLTRGDKVIDVKPGCDVELRLGNGYSELVNPCFGELNQLPDTATIRGEGSGMTFAFPKGWFFLDSSVTCGHLSEQSLTLDLGCDVRSSDQGTSVSIYGPTTAGSWTLGIHGCGTQFLRDATNRVCGTWYATVEVDPS